MKNVLIRGIVAVAFSSVAGHCHGVSSSAVLVVSAQEGKAVSAVTVAGTWNMTMMSHQVALVLEQDGVKVTGTMMMPGLDLKVEGSFSEALLALTATSEGTTYTITGAFEEDGTLAGDVKFARGSAKWNAERLKARK